MARPRVGEACMQAITLESLSAMACSFHRVPPASLPPERRREHGRTIPLADIRSNRLLVRAQIRFAQMHDWKAGLWVEEERPQRPLSAILAADGVGDGTKAQ